MPKKKAEVDPNKQIKRKLYAKTDSNAGSKSKFHLVYQEIIDRVRFGFSLKDRIAGLINSATYYEWLNAGEEDLNQNLNTQFSEFSSKIREAEKDYRKTLLISIKAQALDDWKAATWLLERSDPETYKLKDKVDMNQTVEISQKAILEIPDNERRK